MRAPFWIMHYADHRLKLSTRVNHGEPGVEGGREIRRPLEYTAALRPEIDAARNMTDASAFARDLFFVSVDSSPNGAASVVQDLGCHAAQKEPTKGTVSASRHDDQIRPMFLSVVDDGSGRIPWHLGERHVESIQ